MFLPKKAMLLISLGRAMIPRHPQRGQQRNGVHHGIKALIVYHKQTQSLFNTSKTHEQIFGSKYKI
jgi:hypothetical protein